MSSTASNNEPALPLIALTAGEPAGIGPDLLIAAVLQRVEARLVAFADPALLSQRSRELGRPIDIQTVNACSSAEAHVPGRLPVFAVPLASAVAAGRPDPANAGAILESIRLAVRACLEGAADALVTGPVNKAIINAAGTPFNGHTGFIGKLCAADPVMMLMNDALRVVLVTTHLPLSGVGKAITRERLEYTIAVAHAELQSRFGIRNPALLVCGLNPHAGEGGYLGDEEMRLIGPVLDDLRRRGMNLIGPVAADTAFTPESLRGRDAVIAMYHDQGLAPLKALAFGGIVNITLGLPIIRTSVDHGTALELAGTGRARPDSMLAAIAWAIRLARRRADARSAGAPRRSAAPA